MCVILNFDELLFNIKVHNFINWIIFY